MPAAVAFWILAALFLMLFFASAAASPLYRVYQVEFRFSATTLTAVFAVYVLVLLVTLLLFGSVSDYLGRIPVIISALVFSVAGCAVFLMAHGIGALYGARSLQGIATGLGSGAIGAALIDLQPPRSQRASVVTSAFATLGLALGALITSALVQYAVAPTHLIWWALLGVFIAGIVVVVVAIAEPGTRRPAVLASLRPQGRCTAPVKGNIRRSHSEFHCELGARRSVPVAGAVAGCRGDGFSEPLWGGLVIFLLSGTGAAAVFVFRGISSASAMLAGCLSLLAGMAITFGAIATTTAAAFLIGAAVAGVGFGLAFLGGFRMTLATAKPDESAGLLAAIFIVAYLAFAIPALIAGVATTTYGLHSTALVYSASLAGVAAAAAGILLLRTVGKPARPAPAPSAVLPPGPCTCPPCLEAMNAGGAQSVTTARSSY